MMYTYIETDVQMAIGFFVWYMERGLNLDLSMVFLIIINCFNKQLFTYSITQYNIYCILNIIQMK